MSLNANDLKTLGKEFSGLARAVADWGATHSITDQAQQKHLDDLVYALVETSDDLATAALTAALATVGTSVDGLQNGIRTAQHALTIISDVGKVFSILGAAAGLGGAVLAPVPTAAGIAGALNGLVQATQAALAGPSGAANASAVSSGGLSAGN
jgi:hypothetical protein